VCVLLLTVAGGVTDVCSLPQLAAEKVEGMEEEDEEEDEGGGGGGATRWQLFALPSAYVSQCLSLSLPRRVYVACVSPNPNPNLSLRVRVWVRVGGTAQGRTAIHRSP